MKYEDLLETYEDKLDWVRRQRSHAENPSDYWDGVQIGLLSMYQQLLPLTDFKPMTEKPTEEESKKLVDPETGDKPYAMLVYRGERVPVYLDDYGQQDYMIYRSEVYGGGAYNFNSLFDFCCIIDYMLDEGIRSEKNEECDSL